MWRLNMKETLSVPDLANDFVNEIEDRWVELEMECVDQLHQRAKGSHTLIAQKEFESAKDRLARELDRIGNPDPDPFED